MLTAEFLRQAPAKNKSSVQEILDKLLEKYNEPGRYYHTLAHLEKGLEVYYSLFSTPLTPVEFFAWAYHDSVYDSTRSDNEENSAIIWWRDAHPLGFSLAEADEGATLIVATDPSAKPLSVINDMDLAELGASPEVFDANTEKIRKEYHWVEPEVWRKGRIAVLTQILARPKLYVTKPFTDKFDTQARNNLKQAIAKLSEN
jgi:predicted metal-dependent HD superfamily phosphohydrolase